MSAEKPTRSVLRGASVVVLFILNTLIWAIPIYILIVAKLITPKGRLRNAFSRWMAAAAQLWAACDVLLYDSFHATRWDIRGAEVLKPSGKYLVLSNHQSWSDIFVVMKAFGRRAPFFKFFIKQELIWVPILGLAWWGLDYPFMKRFSAAQIAKNPELKGKDLETTRLACEKYRELPVTVLNYVEGTRFTPAKHAAHGSPYQHLLKPRAGGLAFALAALGDQLSCVLDITVVYVDGAVGFWGMLCGEMGHVVVEIRELPVPAELCQGDYAGDPAFRARIQDWTHQLWLHKDQRIAAILAEHRTTAAS